MPTVLITVQYVYVRTIVEFVAAEMHCVYLYYHSLKC